MAGLPPRRRERRATRGRCSTTLGERPRQPRGPAGAGGRRARLEGGWGRLQPGSPGWRVALRRAVEAAGPREHETLLSVGWSQRCAARGQGCPRSRAGGSRRHCGLQGAELKKKNKKPTGSVVGAPGPVTRGMHQNSPRGRGRFRERGRPHGAGLPKERNRGVQNRPQGSVLPFPQNDLDRRLCGMGFPGRAGLSVRCPGSIVSGPKRGEVGVGG